MLIEVSEIYSTFEKRLHNILFHSGEGKKKKTASQHSYANYYLT